MAVKVPKNKRVKRDRGSGIKLWIFGKPTTGKTWFADKAPDPVIINTDGNIKSITAPNIEGIKGWDDFKKAVDELVAGKHDFQTVIVDLFEDIHQMCRLFVYDEMKIIHEGDLGHGKGWDIQKSQFLGTIKKLMQSDLNVILISHEKEAITKDRIGNEKSTFAPNISPSLVSKIQGYVDYCVRVTFSSTQDEESGEITDTRVMHLIPQSNENGVNRFEEETVAPVIELDWEEFVKAVRYEEGAEAPKALKEVDEKEEKRKSRRSNRGKKKADEDVVEETTTDDEVDKGEPEKGEPEKEEPKKGTAGERRRRRKKADEEVEETSEEIPEDEESEDEEVKEDKPKRSRRINREEKPAEESTDSDEEDEDDEAERRRQRAAARRAARKEGK